jgi:hypothetical protein
MQDIAIMILLIILVPLLYLILPLWLIAALLLLVALNILYFTWEPLLQARWAIWLVTVILLVTDSGAALLGTRQNAFFAVNDAVLLMVVLGPLMGLQYLYWRKRRGQERTTWHDLQEEPMQPR